MENAPLTLAHTHARNAVKETQKANPTAASEEHDLAAGEFASAAKATGDPEALRILRLLELHHVRLAEILKAKPDSQAATSSTVSVHTVQDTIPEEPEDEQEPPKSVESSPRHISHHVPSLNRESSSKLADNLASARGIPANRQRRGNQSPAQVTAQNVEGRLSKPTRRDQISTRPEFRDPKRNSLSPSQATVSKPSLSLASSEHSNPPPPITSANSEDAFAKFYSAFSTIRHTLSAPLAFAGLPLQQTPDPSTPPQPDKPHPRRSARNDKTTPNTSPDLNRLFSRAALRAVRDEHGHPPTDSFYHVPPTGGTVSYAQMLGHARQGSNMTDSNEEFVDASETPQPASPGRSRRSGGGVGGADAGGKPKTIAGIELDPKRKVPPRPGQTYEELYVENGMLKAVAVDLADRLRAFELGAQKSSLALHASMRQFTSPSASTVVPGIAGMASGKDGVPPVPGEQAAVRALDEKVRELEEQVRGLTKENKRLGRENEKLMGVVKRYREKWEALKEGARERIKGGSNASTKDESGVA